MSKLQQLDVFIGTNTKIGRLMKWVNCFDVEAGRM